MNNDNNPNERQGQSKKSKYKQFLKWLCKPQTLRLLFSVGPAIYRIVKWLIELLQI